MMIRKLFYTLYYALKYYDPVRDVEHCKITIDWHTAWELATIICEAQEIGY